MKKKKPNNFCGIVYVTLASASQFLYPVTLELICFFAFLDFEPLWLNNNEFYGLHTSDKDTKKVFIQPLQTRNATLKIKPLLQLCPGQNVLFKFSSGNSV